MPVVVAALTGLTWVTACGEAASHHDAYAVALEALADSGYGPLVVRSSAALSDFATASAEFVFDSAMAEHPSPLADLLLLGRERITVARALRDSLRLEPPNVFMDDDIEARLQGLPFLEAMALHDSLFPEPALTVCVAPAAVRGDVALVVVSDNCWDFGSFHGYYYYLQRASSEWRIIDQWSAWLN